MFEPRSKFSKIDFPEHQQKDNKLDIKKYGIRQKNRRSFNMNKFLKRIVKSGNKDIRFDLCKGLDFVIKIDIILEQNVVRVGQ